MVIEANRQVTLKAITGLSRLCYRSRRWWFAIAAAACVWFAALLVLGIGNSARMLLPLSLLLWALLGLCAGYWLAWTPAPARTSDSRIIRVSKALIGMLYILLFLLIFGLGLSALVLTFRALVLGVF
jgi:hypothetical protein